MKSSCPLKIYPTVHLTDFKIHLTIHFHAVHISLFYYHHSVNLVVSPLYLHWTNDIIRTLRDVYRILTPDGYFTGAMFACDTLKELREVLEKAEMKVDGCLSSHTSPLPTPGAIGDALVVSS